MKRRKKTQFLILYFVFIVGLTCCESKQPKVELDSAISISKAKAGFNIYSNKGELILEFTEQNTDSASLETLDYIYQTAKEFYNRNPYEEENKNKSMKISRIIYER